METRQDNVPTHLTVHILDPVKHFQKLKSMWNRAEEKQRISTMDPLSGEISNLTSECLACHTSSRQQRTREGICEE